VRFTLENKHMPSSAPRLQNEANSQKGVGLRWRSASSQANATEESEADVTRVNAPTAMHLSSNS
jgi:hypothetical protein